MSRNALFVVTLGIVSALAAGVAYGMFAVGPMKEFEKSKIYFAAAVLAFLAFIFLLSMIMYAMGPEPTATSTGAPGKEIFDACVKIIPPLVTLVIGFYFGASQDRAASTPVVTAPPSATATAGR